MRPLLSIAADQRGESDLGDDRYQALCLIRVGGAEGTRTPDPLTASQVRYQLRHSPKMLAHATRQRAELVAMLSLAGWRPAASSSC
jgi:hypothetical protein